MNQVQHDIVERFVERYTQEQLRVVTHENRGHVIVELRVRSGEREIAEALFWINKDGTIVEDTYVFS